MPISRTTRRLLSAYADQEPWKGDHDEAQSCLDIEEKLAWGVHIFRGLVELEARQQARAVRKFDAEAEQFFEVMPLLYQLWLVASRSFLEVAQGYVRSGYAVEGLEAFEATVEEASCLCENLSLEDEIPPIEELKQAGRPVNPRPDRYGD